MSGRIVLALSLCLCLGACADRAPAPATRAPDAQARVAPRPDAAPPVARAAVRRVGLGNGCQCRAVPADAVRAHRAARQAFVKRMDRLNRGLRGLMEALDRGRAQPVLDAAKAAEHQRQRAGLVCQLDCLLTQFVGMTPAAWTWLAQVAHYLDGVRQAVIRLQVAPAKRAPGPDLSALARQYNLVARTSNRSIGIPLLARREIPPRESLDGLSFRGKARQVARAARSLVRPFQERWLIGAKAKRPHPLSTRRVRFRVATVRLVQALEGLRARARALVCGKGPSCPMRTQRWAAQDKALQTLITTLRTARTALRAAGSADLPPARCAQLLAPVGKALRAWQSALGEATQ